MPSCRVSPLNSFLFPSDADSLTARSLPIIRFWPWAVHPRPEALPAWPAAETPAVAAIPANTTAAAAATARTVRNCLPLAADGQVAGRVVSSSRCPVAAGVIAKGREELSPFAAPARLRERGGHETADPVLKVRQVSPEDVPPQPDRPVDVDGCQRSPVRTEDHLGHGWPSRRTERCPDLGRAAQVVRAADVPQPNCPVGAPTRQHQPIRTERDTGDVALARRNHSEWTLAAHIPEPDGLVLVAACERVSIPERNAVDRRRAALRTRVFPQDAERFPRGHIP